MCLGSDGKEVTEGKFELSTRKKQIHCLFDCKHMANATACAFNGDTGKCYGHTQEITSASGEDGNICSILTRSRFEFSALADLI